MGSIGIKNIRFIQRFSTIVNHNIKRLWIGAKFISLQIAPLITNSFDFSCLSVFINFKSFV
jgi:hypothetical protein